MAPVRVLFADDHPVFLSGLRLLAETSGDLTAVGFASSGTEAVDLAMELRPDVVVLDVNMPGVTGISATRRLATQAPGIPVLMLTMFDDDETVFAALRCGARGYVLKGAGPDELLSAIRAVAHGEAVFGSTLATRMLGHFRELGALRPFPELTDREHDVLELVARGLPNAAIARRLALSEKTVRNHVSNILTKLQVDRSQAIVRAREAGLGSGSGSGEVVDARDVVDGVVATDALGTTIGAMGTPGALGALRAFDAVVPVGRAGGAAAGGSGGTTGAAGAGEVPAHRPGHDATQGSPEDGTPVP